jgi:hypothetical protein
MLDREEYIEQAHLFQLLHDRLPDNVPLQDVLEQARQELLATTKLPMAVDFFLAEMRHTGYLAPAMKRLSHYFAPFQTYIMEASEDERGRFDIRVAVRVLRAEANYRAQPASRQGLFLFQFETLARNRLSYDRGLHAMSQDPFYDADWREWILTVRRQVGLVDFADLIYVRSQYSVTMNRQRGIDAPPGKPILFGEKEGRIAWANRRKDPLYLFAALQRQLGFPAVPRLQPVDPTPQLIPQLLRRIDRLETRLKLLEEEQRKGAIDLPKFYQRPDSPPGLADE